VRGKSLVARKMTGYLISSGIHLQYSVTILFSVLLLMQPPRETNPLKIVINTGITIHQKVVAPTQGDVCNFTPSCSRFSKKALKKYGVICGSLMAVDRLMRCNPWAVEHVNTYYSGIKNGKIYDPVENNFIFKKIKKPSEPSGVKSLH
jgi:putative component of membrane protein insertase Oxa1/YidC/SpoIIIJ protein YidD